MDLASAKNIGAGIAVIALVRRRRRHRLHLRRAGQQRGAQPRRPRPRVRPGDPGLRADRSGRAVRAGHRLHHPVRLIPVRRMRLRFGLLALRRCLLLPVRRAMAEGMPQLDFATR